MGETTENVVLGGRVKLRQPIESDRIAIDAVFLAAAVPAHAGERVLDAGSGTGGAALCLAARVSGCGVMGLERRVELVALAKANAELNDCAVRVKFFVGDVADPPSMTRNGEFDHAMANPPFYRAGSGRVSPHSGRAAARTEDGATLSDWAALTARAVRLDGTVTFIHIPERVDELVAALEPSVGAIVVVPLLPREGASARRVVVRGTRGASPSVRFCNGYVLHSPDGNYTAAANAVLRDAEPVVFG